MISIIVWLVAYLIIAGSFFRYLCIQDGKKFITHRDGPEICIFWAVLWPIGFLLSVLRIIYGRSVDGK